MAFMNRTLTFRVADWPKRLIEKASNAIHPEGNIQLNKIALCNVQIKDFLEMDNS